jgi:endo-1,3-1,4-beta-glycanase ExoK
MRHPFVMMMLVILGLSAAHCDGTNSSDDTEGTDDTVSTDSENESDGPFELLWTDDFDTIDTSKWQLMTHTWDGNLALFTGANASVSDGILSLALTETPDDTEKPFRGVEMRSIDTLTYGKLEASIRFSPGSAVVSSLVLIYTPWPPDDWNEIDIEFLGKNTQDIQFNHMVNIPPADPETGHIQFPHLAALDFDATEDFHTYTIEWVPEEVRFFVDGTLMYTATEEVSYLTLPQNILMTIWASDAPGWAGPVDDTTSPTSVTYDWIKVYRYIGE